MVREKASADLFTLDTKGDKELPKKHPKHTKKGLKADEIIAQRSSIPAVNQRKRAGDDDHATGSKTTNGLVPAKRQRTDWVSQKELTRLKKVADGQHANTVEIKDADYDLWDAPTSTSLTEQKAQQNSEFLPELTKQAKAPKSMRQKPLSLTANGKTVPAVQKPTGGYSYNPMFTDYEERLTAESKKALEAEQKRLKEIEEAESKREAAAKSAAEAEAAEARANLSEWEEDSEWEGFQSGVEDDENKPVVKRPQRKTPVQRNRAKRRKEEERLAKHRAQLKARRQQEHRIKDIAQEVDERNQSRALMQQQQTSDSELDEDIGEEKLRRKQLGKFKLPEKDLELVLPDELQESLRLLRPEGNLLKDRYRNMLVRGKVEARRHIPFKKQAKRKFTEKWTHKDFVL